MSSILFSLLIGVSFFASKQDDTVIYKSVQAVQVNSIFVLSDTALIGNLVWMTKNLDVDTFRNGDKIQQVKTVEEWSYFYRKKIPAWCYYQFDQNHSERYGKLYNWYAVIDKRGVSPVGWRIPERIDWLDLKIAVGDISGAHSLKSVSDWQDENGNNSSGFNALPSGAFINNEFVDLGLSSYFWCLTDYCESDNYLRRLRCRYGFVFFISHYYSLLSKGDADIYDVPKQNGYAIRCVKNKPSSAEAVKNKE